MTLRSLSDAPARREASVLTWRRFTFAVTEGQRVQGLSQRAVYHFLQENGDYVLSMFEWTSNIARGLAAPVGKEKVAAGYFLWYHTILILRCPENSQLCIID